MSERTTPSFVDSPERLRPLRDHILLQPLEWEASKTLAVIRSGRPLRGIVQAIGPGTHPKKYLRNANGQKRAFRYSRHFQRTELQVGDVVELGGLNIYDGAGYRFPEVVVDGIPHLLIQEADVAGVVSL